MRNLNQNEMDAINAANAPSTADPFATVADTGGGAIFLSKVNNTLTPVTGVTNYANDSITGTIAIISPSDLTFLYITSYSTNPIIFTTTDEFDTPSGYGNTLTLTRTGSNLYSAILVYRSYWEVISVYGCTAAVSNT